MTFFLVRKKEHCFKKMLMVVLIKKMTFFLVRKKEHCFKKNVNG